MTPDVHTDGENNKSDGTSHRGSIRRAALDWVNATRRTRRRHAKVPAKTLATRAALEALEGRCLLSGVTATTAAPFISEFLAVNNSGLKDEDGDRPDWIELYNPTPGDVNLAGYHLTDDATVLDKWTFPSVTIPSGGFLTVFASGKDRALAGSPLHTNFSLDSAGEYLGLIAPNGTVLSDFAPTYPEQVADVSYGIAVNQSTAPLIRQRATARTLVPVDGSLGSTWQQPNFDDSGWIAGTTGVGYENEAPPPLNPGFRTRMVDVTGADLSHIGIATSILDSADGTAGGLFTVESDTSVVSTVINMGPGGRFTPDDLLPNGATSADQYAIRSNAVVTIPAGTWTIAVNSDDGFRLKIPGVTFTNRVNENSTGVSGVVADTLVYGGQRGASDTLGTFTVPAGGLTTTLQLDFYENFGGDSVEMSIASGQRITVDTTNFALLGNTVKGWTVSDPQSTGGTPNYRSLLGTDVGAQMFNKATSAYVRVPFSVAAASDVSALRLQMKYDDGFVAYINGVEVARRNAPDPVAFNSAATANQPDASALIYESFAVPPGALRNGSNVLAVQMLNVSAGSSDLLMYPELQGMTATLGDVPSYFGDPTPGAVNSPSGTQGVVRDTKFSVDRGFYDAPFQVAITSATTDAQIRYTTNGSTPTPTNGIIYTGPITIDKTTTLRAAAFKTGWLSANVDTQTYIFLDDVIRQSPTAAPGPGWPAPGQVNGQIINYGMDPDIVNSATWGPQIKNALKALPTFSIVTDTKNLFDPATGIYVNPSGDERVWERPASVELINPDGSKGFQIDAGLRIRGGYSRSGNNPKHAFRLFFRGEYDGKLHYPLFGTNGTDTFDGIDLRTTENYSWAFEGNPGSIFMRDQFSRDTQLAMGEPAERGNWYHLYIDGQYWGLYNTDERAEANYGATYFGGSPDDYDVVKVDPDLGYNIEATDGNLDAWNQLYQSLHGTVTEDVFQQIQGNKPDGTPDPTKPVLLDVDNLIDYMLVIYYGGNLDAAISNFLGNSSPNNFFAMRNRQLDARMGFKFFAHDSEHTLLDVNQNRLGPSTGLGWNDNNWSLAKSNPQYFFQRLWTLPSFKQEVADRVQKFMVNPGGPLTPAEAKKRLTARRDEISLATVAESARWGDSKREPPITRNDFTSAINAVINTYMTSRTGNVISQFRQWGLLPAFNGPIYSQQGGQVAAGYQLSITPGINTPANSVIYYTTDGTDPRARDGSVSATAVRYAGPLTINDTVTVKARTLSPTNVWSGANVATFSLDVAALRVTELMYNPAPPGAGSAFSRDDFEYVELMNTGPTDLDLEGIKLDTAINFTFPAGTTLASGARVLVVKNRAAFESRYGVGVGTIAGTYTGSLSDSGEFIRVVGATGQVALAFAYSDSWYSQTDGQGYSLTVVDPTAPAANWNLKSQWKASGPPGGTPGAPDPIPASGAIIVNEVLANPQAGGSDFVELRNTTGAAIDVGNWFISDDKTNLKKFQLPAGATIPANGYLVYDQAALGFDIAAAGGEVFLSSGDAADNLGGYRESARFAASDPGVSFGQYVKSTGGTDFVATTSPTPGLANAGPLVGPVVINEIMYQPGTGKTEYIELRNLTGSPVVLNDPANPTGPWKFVDGIDYALPDGATIPAFGYALVVPIDPTAFRDAYDVPPNVNIYGPYQRTDGTNNLENAGENLTLYRPVAAGYALADRVNYTAVAPWPVGANGTGASIARGFPQDYGNDPVHWSVEQPGGTPGRANLDLAGPLADVLDVTPDPRTAPVDQITISFDEPVKGLDLADLSLTRDGGANLLTGNETLTTTHNVRWTVGNLSGLTTAAGSYTLALTAAGSGITDWGGNAFEVNASDTWRTGAAPSGRVVGRYVFYNNSRFDGGADGAANDGAIAPDKQALLPGQTATFSNYTSFSRGINGVMFDATGVPSGALTAADFSFQVGNDSDPSAWTNAAAPLSITRRAGAGVNGSDRFTLTWADGAVKNQWLRVTVLPTARTGLPAADVFYFGNLCGETGNNAAAAAVTSTDQVMIRRNYTFGMTVVPITNRYDFNRDGKVNAIDLTLARRGALSGTLTMLTAPGGAGAASVQQSSSSSTVFSQSMIAPQPAATSGDTSGTTASSLLGTQTDVLGRA